jgi:hypothetical protein
MTQTEFLFSSRYTRSGHLRQPKKSFDHQAIFETLDLLTRQGPISFNNKMLRRSRHRLAEGNRPKGTFSWTDQEAGNYICFTLPVSISNLE